MISTSAYAPIAPVAITAHTVTTSLGRGCAVHAEALAEGRSGLTPLDDADVPFACFVGAVAGLDAVSLPPSALAYDNRATRLVVAALEADDFARHVRRARERWGAARTGLVVGTSTAGVERLERCYRHRTAGAALPADYSLRHHNDHHAVAACLQELLGLQGPAFTVSTACSSSAKALVDAAQLVAGDLLDAVVVVGCDSLCLTSLAGFEALQLLARGPSRPLDAQRAGISIGEGAGLLLVERGPAEGLRLVGYGESSDATTMSTPPADGAGAAQAMRAALARSGLIADAVDYVNLHGTGTLANDVVECRAVEDVLSNQVPVSSLKGAIGHTLGAAGAIEAALCLIALEAGLLPANVGLETVDAAIGCRVVGQPGRATLRHAMSNAFGFGGNNCTLILGA